MAETQKTKKTAITEANDLAKRKLTLVEKLAGIRAISDVVVKEKRGYNYTYADITTILANITAGMKTYKVSLYPRINPGTMNVQQVVTEQTKFTKTGEQYINKVSEMMVSAEMEFRWVNDEDPDDYMIIPWIVVGSQSDPSQALGSGLTYTLRQFLTNFFQIAQADTDVDAFRSKQKEAEGAEDRAIAEAIIAEFEKKLKIFITDNRDKEDEVVKFISRYAKGAKYNAIKDPALASKLLEDFTSRYLSKEEK